MASKKQQLEAKGAEDAQRAINGYIRDAIEKAEKLLKGLPELEEPSYTNITLEEKSGNPNVSAQKVTACPPQEPYYPQPLPHVFHDQRLKQRVQQRKKKKTKQQKRGHFYPVSSDDQSQITPSVDSEMERWTSLPSASECPSFATYQRQLKVQQKSKESGRGEEELSARATINTLLQADAKCNGLMLNANLIVTRPDGRKENIQMCCEMPDYRIQRVIVDGQEFRRV